MKQILLVDDDAFFRSMFSGMLPWNAYGFALLQAENGREAIELLNKNKDIVLVFTDMNMPLVGGVELIRCISSSFKEIRCIALSAYDDFDYVKASFKCGVDDYLLKHTLTKEQLIEILEKYTDVKSRNSSVSYEENDAQRARFLYDFITGSYTSVAQCEALFASLSLPVFTRNLLLAVLIADTPEGTIILRGTQDAAQSHLRTLLCMLQNMIDCLGSGAAFRGPDDGLIYLVITASGFESLQFSEQTAKVLTEQAEATLLRYFNLKTRIYHSPVCRQANSLRETYLSMMKETGREVSLTPEENGVSAPSLNAEEMADELVFGTADGVRQLLSAVYTEARRQRCGRMGFAGLYTGCLSLWRQLSVRLVGKTDASLTEQPDKDASDIKQEELLTGCFLELFRTSSAAARAKYSPVVFGAFCVIHRDYADDRLFTAGIAKVLHANPSYLSRLFKEQTGKNLSDYLNDRRMVCVCRYLAKGTLSVREAAARCGYGNYNYFFKVFKKRIGITPKEYQLQALSGVKGPDE